MNGSPSFPKISPHRASKSFKKKREKNMFQQLSQSFGSLCTGETHCSSPKCIDVHLVLKRQLIQEYFLWTKAIMNCTGDVKEFSPGVTNMLRTISTSILSVVRFSNRVSHYCLISIGMVCVKHSEMFLLIVYSFPAYSLLN